MATKENIVCENVKWIDITEPNTQEIQAISQQYHLHYELVRDCMEPDHLPKYDSVDEVNPNQLNTSILNGALFLGYRTDIHHLRYKKTPFQTYKREITHYGLSFGIFTGIGASRIDEFVTLNALTIQYDGFVNPSGVAAIIAVDKLTFGLTLGVDHLLDKNRKVWIYQGKPWMGLSIGLNLN